MDSRASAFEPAWVVGHLSRRHSACAASAVCYRGVALRQRLLIWHGHILELAFSLAMNMMWYVIAADLVLVAHLLFIGFVVGGSFLAWRWPWVIWVQLSAMVYGALVELSALPAR